MRLLPLCLLLLGPLSTSWATTIQFDELGTVSPIDVNGIHIQGVMFGFSPDRAFFNRVRTNAPPFPGLTCWNSTIV